MHWICYVEGTDGGSFYHHSTLKDAKREAERLALLPSVKGENVLVYECVGIYRAIPSPVLVWDEC